MASFKNYIPLVWFTYTAALAADSYKILSYIPSKTDGSDLVLIEGGRNDGLNPGSTLRVYRPKESIHIETGMLKVVGVFPDRCLAEVISQGTEQSKMMFEQFPGVMAGDFVAPQRLSIARVQKLAAELTMTFDSLFEDPRANPSTFELTDAGLDVIANAGAELGSIRAKLLIVEGHTDAAISTDASQVESYQRALTVRQVLVDKLGFDSKRVTAVGLGKSNLADETNTPESLTKNRRIVLKVVPISE